MSSDFEVFVDSDAFVGWILPHDVHFPAVSQAFTAFEAAQKKLVTSSWVVAETATVLSYRDGQHSARQFLEYARSGTIAVIFVDEALQDASERLFLAQEKKGTSMVDCANVAIIKHFHIPTIFSFDAVYVRKFHLQQAVEQVPL